MILSDVFERFAQQSPVAVMARAALEHAFSPLAIDSLFEQTNGRQHTRTLMFSSVVDVMGAVVTQMHAAVHAAYRAKAEVLGVSIRALYDKFDRTKPALSAELVRHTARPLGPVIIAMGGERVAWLPGYRVKILDGNHFTATAHRLKELRTTNAGALPGKALVVLDPEVMLITDVFPCEDGHAQERSLLGPVLETIQSGTAWIADRNFCTTDFLLGIDRRGGAFAIRQQAATLPSQAMGERRECGRGETGMVFERELRLSAGDEGTMTVRRVTVELDMPTRDGETEFHILTVLQAARICGFLNVWNRRVIRDAIDALCFPSTSSRQSVIASLNRAKSSSYRHDKLSVLTNFHSRSIRLRLGEYGGKYNNSIRSRSANSCTTAHF